MLEIAPSLLVYTYAPTPAEIRRQGRQPLNKYIYI